jgi:all-trans-retinol 13,14-reductase
MPPQPFSVEALDAFLSKTSSSLTHHDNNNSNNNTSSSSNIKPPTNNVDVIIVGSGIGGLTAASLCAQVGKSVIVLERSPQTGGATHSFQDSGFKFEMGLQDVGGQVWKGMEGDPASKLLFQATGGMVEWTQSLPYSHVIMIGKGEQISIPPTWEAFRKILIEKFPSEIDGIDRYYQDVMETRQQAIGWMFNRLPTSTSTTTSSANAMILKGLSLLKHNKEKKDPHGLWGAKEFSRKALESVEDHLESIISDPKLRYVLTFLWGKYGLPPQVASWVAHCLVAGSFLDGCAFPKGGAGQIEKACVSMIEKNHGIVFVNAPVTTIMIEKGICYGVQLENGRIIRAGKVISAIGASNTYERLVPKTYADLVKVPLEAVRDLRWSSYAILQVFLGFDGSCSELGLETAGYWFLPDSIDHSENSVRYFLDSTFSVDFPYVHVSFPSAKDPLAKTSTGVIFAAAHYDWFKGMQAEDVKAVADEIVRRLTDKLYEKFPQLKSRVKFVELATPLAHEFHLNASRGAPLGLGHTPNRFEHEWLRPQSSIKNLILGGQDVYTCSVIGACTGGFMGAAAAFPKEIFSKYKGLFE